MEPVDTEPPLITFGAVGPRLTVPGLPTVTLLFSVICPFEPICAGLAVTLLSIVR